VEKPNTSYDEGHGFETEKWHLHRELTNSVHNTNTVRRTPLQCTKVSIRQKIRFIFDSW